MSRRIAEADVVNFLDNYSESIDIKPQDKRPTLKTIADMVGVGTATVSKALNDAPDIGQDTKERIRLIAREIGYQPDRNAVRLRSGKTNVINLVLGTDEEFSGVMSQLIGGITEALESTQYNLVVSPQSKTTAPIDTVRQIVETRAADGIILSGTMVTDSRVAYLDESGFPFATHGRTEQGLQHAYFDFDNKAFGQNAVQILAQLKRSRVGIIMPPSKQTYARHMLDGFEIGLKETGLDGSVVTGVTIGNSIEEISQHISRLLKSPDRPDGIIAGSVSTTIGVVNGIETAGFIVGEDIDVVAKQTTGDFLRWFGRPVHSIKEDFRAAGFGLANSLVKMIDDDAPVEDHQTVAFPEIVGQKVTDNS